MGQAREIARLPNAPAFNVYAILSTSLVSGANTKVEFQQEDTDTNGNFASSRFTPTVAGYYQINASVKFDGSTVNPMTYIRKNSSTRVSGNYIPGTHSSPITIASALIYLNGSTDYIEVDATHSTGSAVNTYTTGNSTRFSACFVRPT